jgi:hypothetical protein
VSTIYDGGTEGLAAALDGWSGVTDEEKRAAGGRLPAGASLDGRLRNGAQVANTVARLWGHGTYTEVSG